MARVVCVSLIAFLFSSAARAQTERFVLKVDNLSFLVSWDNFTDYDETGHLTESTGSEQRTISQSFDADFDPSRNERNGDTLMYFTRYHDLYSTSPNAQLRIVLDKPYHIENLTYQYSSRNIDGSDTTYTFSSTNIDLDDSGAFFYSHLSDSEIPSHNLFDSSYTYFYIQSGDQSFTTIAKNTLTIDSNSSISMSIPKMLSSIVTEVANHLSPDMPLVVSNKLYAPVIEHAVIIDALGRSILNASHTDCIDIHFLTAGLYFLKTSQSLQRFIVSR